MKNLFASASRVPMEKPEKDSTNPALKEASRFFKRINRRGFIYHRGGQLIHKPDDQPKTKKEKRFARRERVRALKAEQEK